MITANEHTNGASRSRARALWLVVATCGLVAIVGFWRHAASYFFLFDDFALVSIAKSQSFSGLLTGNFIGFYRPLGFVILWIGGWLFDWDAPSGYAALSLTLHAIASVCCFGLARTLALDRLTSALAGLLCLLSPWATEAFLWVSSVYDLLATCGVLASLWCLRLIVDAGVSRSIAARVSLAVGACAFAFVAFFAKESAIVLPALAIVWVVVSPTGPLTARHVLVRGSWMLVCTVVPMAVYLVVRVSKMSGLFSGAYGEFGQLWRNADIAHNVWTYVRMAVLPPLPAGWSTEAVLVRIGFVYPFLGAVAPAALVRGLVERPRIISACVLSVLVSIAPVAWFGLALNNTFSGRFMYLAGAWFALGVACALGRVLAHARVRTAVAAAALTIACGYYASSLLYQARLWRTASAVSRSVVRQVEAYRGRTDRALHVTNLPNMSTEGPLLLKAYSFRLYRDGKGMPPVRADIVLLRLTDGVSTVAPLGADAFSDYQADGRPEVSITLDVTPQPPAR